MLQSAGAASAEAASTEAESGTRQPDKLYPVTFTVNGSTMRLDVTADAIPLDVGRA
ncbi:MULTISPECIES: hypothetical protein [unclassified Paraburkholderia]|uniref:hypothetical protein n=1 Tax=unclassified Paraburkholderia TaxID=2615204 RepID=UPI001614F22F|nr:MULTISPECIES: hypothetical protein [unclassified Paraburkholderia]MBB5448195.1 hypothetical protein [Paraburkholderia sp. WSM4177]MBB5483694.1 hypothetical protein [Paraburkholderia sp. WSM4180]